MHEYTITWTIQLSAETPRAAALAALEIQRDVFSSAIVFEVTDKAGTVTIVDLETVPE